MSTSPTASDPRDQLINAILMASLQLQRQTDYCVFINYYGQVNWLYIQIQVAEQATYKDIIETIHITSATTIAELQDLQTLFQIFLNDTGARSEQDLAAAKTQ